MRMRSGGVVAAFALLAACGGTEPSNITKAAAAAKTETPVAAATPTPMKTTAASSSDPSMWDWSRGGAVNCYDRNRVTQRQAEVAERSGAAPCDGEKATAPSAAASGDWAGHYEGPFDGGPGSVTLMQERKDSPRYHVRVAVSGEGGCSGEAQGMGTPRGNSMTLHSLGSACEISLIRQGRSLRVGENNCSDMHGIVLRVLRHGAIQACDSYMGA